MSLHSVGILTISDTAHKDPASDTAGPFLRSSLESHPSDGFRVVVHSIVPDEPGIIQSTVKKWIDQTGVTLCITTGGTGFGIRDSTREALEPLINKPTPALSHALTSYSLTKTPFAALSRPLTGIRTKGHGTAGSLIVTLPGSKKAVKECLEVLIGDGNSQGILLHALDLISGGSGKGVHRDLQGSSGARDSKTDVSTNTDTGKAHTHSHNHHHHHHSSHGHGHGHHAPKPRTQGYLTLDPNSPNSQRHRQSPYPIIPLTEALDLIVKNTPSPNESSSFKPMSLPIDSSLVSHVLAEDVRAIKDLPSGPTTNVDGYAVSAAQTPIGEYQVVTATTLAQRVSSGEPAEIKKGEVFRINTGQGLPVGTDSVVMVEDTLLIEENKSEGLGKGEELKIKVLAQVDKGENVRPKGSDVREGDVVLTKGSNISSLGGEIGTLAFVGRTEVLVHRKPKIAILSTGNELVDINSSESSSFKDDTWGFSVFDSNRPGLIAAIKGQGYDVLDLGIVGDDIEATLKALRKGLDESDMIITTGGTSMGESDLLKPLIERELKGKIHFGRVAMKPGKPTTFATVDHSSPAPASSSNTAVSSKFIFALPGNPASALVCFHVFVLPCLRKLSGHTSSENGYSNPKIKVTLSSRMKLDQRPEFHRTVVKVEDGKLIAFSTGSQRSSGMHSMATSNALICLPSSDNSDKKALEVGDEADAVVLGPIL